MSNQNTDKDLLLGDTQGNIVTMAKKQQMKEQKKPGMLNYSVLLW